MGGWRGRRESANARAEGASGGPQLCDSPARPTPGVTQSPFSAVEGMCRGESTSIAVVTGAFLSLAFVANLLSVSIPEFSESLQRVLEPRAPSPSQFLIGPWVALVEGHGGAGATSPDPLPEGAQVQGQTCPGLVLRNCCAGNGHWAVTPCPSAPWFPHLQAGE